ncbi:putative permeases [Holospora elegans E1]|uniref:Putative permeases n=1 Tax=Holospora elegans E1 TaxID=1427503 RepID=A0A023DX61_9PROT|nr:LptF/LptG family permease [Holospora elegans]GAJ45921.1 putative permeases [Holospora elegans E1]
MKRFQKYIFRALFKYTLLFFLGLNALTWFVQFFRISKGISGRGASLSNVAVLSIISLVPMMYYTLPMALILACVYRYTYFVQDRERDILYSAGIGPWSLAWPSVKLALYFIVFLYSVGFFWGQKVARYVQIEEMKLRQVMPHHWLTPGVFFSIGDATLYIHNKKVDGILEGVLLHEPKPKRTIVFSGKYGSINQDNQDLIFTLYQGTCHVFMHNSRKAPYVMSFKTYIVRIPHHKKISLPSPKPQGVEFVELLKHVQDGDAKMPWVRELYTRCFSPLWMIPNVLWIAWIVLSGQSINIKSYYRYGILFLGLIIFQAIPLGAVYVWHFWGRVRRFFGLFPEFYG